MNTEIEIRKISKITGNPCYFNEGLILSRMYEHVSAEKHLTNLYIMGDNPDQGSVSGIAYQFRYNGACYECVVNVIDWIEFDTIIVDMYNETKNWYAVFTSLSV